MPIRAEQKAKYPKDWKQISLRIRTRDKNRCKWCGVHNHAWGYRDAKGEFHQVRKGPLRDAGCIRPPFKIDAWSDYPRRCEPGITLKIIEIVLTVAHILDDDPVNVTDENLAALCQRCHNRHDIKSRISGRRQRELEKHPQLFA